jgi:hypothetical protein
MGTATCNVATVSMLTVDLYFGNSIHPPNDHTLSNGAVSSSSSPAPLTFLPPLPPPIGLRHPMGVWQGVAMDSLKYR